MLWPTESKALAKFQAVSINVTDASHVQAELIVFVVELTQLENTKIYDFNDGNWNYILLFENLNWELLENF